MARGYIILMAVLYFEKKFRCILTVLFAESNGHSFKVVIAISSVPGRIMVCRIIFNCNLKWDLNPIATYPDKIESDFVYFGFSE
ncbi:MAG: hypothetical protein R2814_09100 [Flavobacteriaceae bacterium]